MILTLSQALELSAQKDLLIRELVTQKDAQIIEVAAQKDAQIAELLRKLESLQRQLTTLQHQMEQMLRRLYGRKSEQLNPNQVLFDSIILESIEQNAAQTPPEPPAPVETVAVKTRKASEHHGRVPIPEHLERVEILLDIPEEQKVCSETGEPLKVISVEVSEKLEYRPGKLIVNVYKRPQYALPENADSFGGVIAAAMPDHPIEKCKADVGLLAHVIVSKFADHLPLYRQDGIFEREGVTIPRATQSSWLMQLYESVKPLEETFRQALFESDVLFTDDTSIPLQVKGHGSLKKGRLWAYVRGGTGPPLTTYDFSIDRSKRRPLDYLNDYKGYVHADAYSGYNDLFRKPGVVEVGCWAHARRKFDEAASSRPKEATDILGRIARLYHEVETPCAGMKPEERRRFRQEHAAPLLAGIFDKIEALRLQTIPSEPLRKAIDYALNQRKALCRYLEDGRLRPDNNLAENAIRPVALGRKNWLFVGSERGGRAAALFMGLVKSCKDCDVNPWQYFDDMLRRIMSHPVKRLR
ncbi:MAG: IS66 family transposase, partial [Desulfuromonadales bacterium]|nr:IS66 family transposase [Desulfuromonadales bacterium]